jgi:hypothetical protein
MKEKRKRRDDREIGRVLSAGLSCFETAGLSSFEAALRASSG